MDSADFDLRPGDILAFSRWTSLFGHTAIVLEGAGVDTAFRMAHIEGGFTRVTSGYMFANARNSTGGGFQVAGSDIKVIRWISPSSAQAASQAPSRAASQAAAQAAQVPRTARRNMPRILLPSIATAVERRRLEVRHKLALPPIVLRPSPPVAAGGSSSSLSSSTSIEALQAASKACALASEKHPYSPLMTIMCDMIRGISRPRGKPQLQAERLHVQRVRRRRLAARTARARMVEMGRDRSHAPRCAGVPPEQRRFGAADPAASMAHHRRAGRVPVQALLP